MAANLAVSLVLNHQRGSVDTSINSPSVIAALGDAIESNTITVTEAAAMAVPLGAVTTPALLYARNADATNYIVILDDTAEIARIYPSSFPAIIPLPAGVDLKAQANTADAQLEYAVFQAAS